MSANRKKTVLTALGLGSVFLLWRHYALYEKYTPTQAAAEMVVEPGGAGATAASPPGAPIPDPAAEQALTAALEAQHRVESQSWGRDPFDAAPFLAAAKNPSPASTDAPVAALPQPPRIRFSGVSRTGDQWLAAVNGRIVRVGDVLDESFRIAAISRSGITLESAGWAFEYSMGCGTGVPPVRPRAGRPCHETEKP